MNKKGKKSKHNVFRTLKEVPVNPLSHHILLQSTFKFGCLQARSPRKILTSRSIFWVSIHIYVQGTLKKY